MANWKKVIVSGSGAELSSLALDTALPVGSGGTGATSLTDGGILLGSGTGAITATAVLANGQLLIGDGSGDPTIATITGGSGIAVTNGAGSITIAADGLGAGTVTSVDTAGTVNGLTLTGGAITTTGTITLGGTLSGIANAALTNDDITIGSTAIALGASATTITGLTSVTSTTFVGALTGNADTATTATTANGVAANSVALGTDTTGDYVATLGVGTGVTIGSNSGETSSPTIAVDYGSSANNAVEGNTTISYTATSGELTVDAGSSITLGAGGTVTYGLADTITGDRTFSGDTITIANDLIVQGTASFQETTNLRVADRFVLFASGSNSAGDGGIVVQQTTADTGELFGYENGVTRWAFKRDFDSSNPSFTADAYVTTTEVSTAIPTTAPEYGGATNGYGNIHVKTDTGDIYIYA